MAEEASALPTRLPPDTDEFRLTSMAAPVVMVVLAAAVLLFTEAEKPPTCTPLMVMKPAATVVALLAALLPVVADKAVEPPTSELPKLKAVTPVSPE